MGKLVAIIGNSGVGKTTLARQLSRAAPFLAGLEQHAERPFQALFARRRRRFALANLVDYLLFRAGQEQALRQSAAIGILDGGLEQDFHVFTRLFYQKGYLDEAEFRLCERLYRFSREFLQPPYLFIWLVAPLEVLEARFAARQDLRDLEDLVAEMVETLSPARLLILDASASDPTFSNHLPRLIKEIKSLSGTHE